MVLLKFYILHVGAMLMEQCSYAFKGDILFITFSEVHLRRYVHLSAGAQRPEASDLLELESGD